MNAKVSAAVVSVLVSAATPPAGAAEPVDTLKTTLVTASLSWEVPIKSRGQAEVEYTYKGTCASDRAEALPDGMSHRGSRGRPAA